MYCFILCYPQTIEKMAVPVKILCILMLLLHKSSQQEVFNDKETLNPPANYKIGWMETLDDEKLISKITIPGTHESLALHGGPLAECQSWSLENQLKAGIRYFDLRVSGFELIVMHGPIYQHTTLSEVLITIRKFLSEFTTETVLVRVKPIFPMKGKVQNLVENEIKNAKDIWVKPSVPRIGEVRGKIVFVQKNSFKLGIILSETDKKGDYKVTNVKVKEEKIKKHLEEAANQCRTGSALSLSYSSGTSLGTYMLIWILPNGLAKQINPCLYDHLEKEFKNNSKPCFGIIAMDFPGLDLIQTVIKFNT
ncbi:1-phosphatidylinositol phosphodiesterase-like [Megalobrama amblycephala]|uniref:1-phosphatidylinositol phosphodiesterase-like n=1 Tax=Megalobrama amblycephala TaxID=75352 RepID=UPI00201432C1|nr:1-phosphatidylinositol phosphodiesterase-like [Megalobrama amblycephala]